jgi:predicted NAD/FAD-dependent oxidoreductase
MTQNNKPAIAIIGSGIAGLACASNLADRFSISIFEKSRGFSGRMSTRRAQEHQFDHGAQYFRAHSDAFKAWLEPLRMAGHVQKWQARSVAIAADGSLTEKPDAQDKWVFAPSMNIIGKVILAGRPQIKAYLDCQIDKISGAANAWHVHSGADSFGPFAHIVLAIPAAQAVALLPSESSLTDALSAVEMIGCHTLMLGYADGEVSLPDWDCAHFEDEILGFASVNSRKPARGGGDALVVQTNHHWSEKHIESDMDLVAQRIKQRFAELTGLPIVASGYDRLHRWRFASTSLSNAVSTRAPFLSDDRLGISAIGDWCIGSKVEDGFLSGASLDIASARPPKT